MRNNIPSGARESSELTENYGYVLLLPGFRQVECFLRQTASG
jgi:hypothetical protein